MSDHEQDRVPQPFHREGDALVFDAPPDPKEIARQRREDEQHEFARSQVKTNKRILWFTGALVFATFCTIGVGIWQATISQEATNAATRATKSAEWSAYWTCLSSQAAQNGYAQAQSGADDSHAMAVAAIQQAAAEMQSERSSMFFLPRIPNPGENLGPNFGLVVEAKNLGKGDAKDVVIKYWAVLLKKTDTLRFDQPPKQQIGLSIANFPAGLTFPEKAEPPHGQLFEIAPLRDASGNLVSTTSPNVADLLNGGTTMAYVFGNIAYADIAGHHAERFCRAIWVMNGNTQRSGEMSDNERRCVKYRRADPQFTYKPLGQPQPSGNAVASQIMCVKPKD